MHPELPQPDGVRAGGAALEQHALDDRLCHEGIDYLSDDGDDSVDWIDVLPEVARLLAGADDPGEAVKQRADIMWLQNDCIYNEFVRPSLSRETIQEIEGRLE